MASVSNHHLTTETLARQMCNEIKERLTNAAHGASQQFDRPQLVTLAIEQLATRRVPLKTKGTAAAAAAAVAAAAGAPAKAHAQLAITRVSLREEIELLMEELEMPGTKGPKGLAQAMLNAIDKSYEPKKVDAKTMASTWREWKRHLATRPYVVAEVRKRAKELEAKPHFSYNYPAYLMRIFEQASASEKNASVKRAREAEQEMKEESDKAAAALAPASSLPPSKRAKAQPMHPGTSNVQMLQSLKAASVREKLQTAAAFPSRTIDDDETMTISVPAAAATTGSSARFHIPAQATQEELLAIQEKLIEERYSVVQHSESYLMELERKIEEITRRTDTRKHRPAHSAAASSSKVHGDGDKDHDMVGFSKRFTDRLRLAGLLH